MVLALAVVSLLAGARPCAPPHVAVSLGPYVGEATEQHTLALRLVNRGDRVCILDGYPRLVLSDARGAIRFRITHRGDQMISARRPKPVRVYPGRAAFVVLNKNTCVGKSARAARTLELATSAGSVSFRFPKRMAFPWRVPTSCADAGDPGSTIAVSPFVPTLRAALNG